MPGVGVACHELRVVDGSVNWRIMYHVAADAIVILDVFQKKTAATPQHVIQDCRQRLAAFRTATQSQKGTRHAKR
jgi:phage-related protein